MVAGTYAELCARTKCSVSTVVARDHTGHSAKRFPCCPCPGHFGGFYGRCGQRPLRAGRKESVPLCWRMVCARTEGTASPVVARDHTGHSAKRFPGGFDRSRSRTVGACYAPRRKENVMLRRGAQCAPAARELSRFLPTGSLRGYGLTGVMADGGYGRCGQRPLRVSGHYGASYPPSPSDC